MSRALSASTYSDQIRCNRPIYFHLYRRLVIKWYEIFGLFGRRTMVAVQRLIFTRLKKQRTRLTSEPINAPWNNPSFPCSFQASTETSSWRITSFTSISFNVLVDLSSRTRRSFKLKFLPFSVPSNLWEIILNAVHHRTNRPLSRCPFTPSKI